MRWGLAIVAWGAIALLASGCETQDISGPEALEITAGQGSTTAAFEHPYLGRLAVDYGLRNGDASGVFNVRVQVQTSGAIDEPACENGVSSAPRLLQALPADGDIETLREQDRAHFISRDQGDDETVIQVRIPTTSAWRFYSSESGLTLRTLDGDLIAPSEITETASCSLFTTVSTYSLTDSTYTLVIENDETTVLLEEACEDVRTVPATCPGDVQSVFTTDPIGLDPNGFISGRLPAHTLGIGDRSVVEITCNALTPECSGTLELFFVLEPLECRTDLDCRNTETCQTDGYCARTTAGCTAATTPALAPLFAFIVAFLGRRRR